MIPLIRSCVISAITYIIITRLKGDSSPLLSHVTAPPRPQISDSLSSYDPVSPQWRFHSLQYSFLLCPAVAVLGGVFYLVNALYITRDKMAAQRFSQGNFMSHQ